MRTRSVLTVYKSKWIRKIRPSPKAKSIQDSMQEKNCINMVISSSCTEANDKTFQFSFASKKPNG